MTKKIFYILTTLLLMTSCEFEMSDNGTLDGLWQMTEMQETGKEAVDMRETGTIWGFQFRLLELRNKSKQNGILCRFEHKGNHLRIYEPYNQEHDVQDTPITDPIVLNPFGLYTLDEDFNIETLTNNEMILVSNRTRLKFRKY